MHFIIAPTQIKTIKSSRILDRLLFFLNQRMALFILKPIAKFWKFNAMKIYFEYLMREKIKRFINVEKLFEYYD